MADDMIRIRAELEGTLERDVRSASRALDELTDDALEAAAALELLEHAERGAAGGAAQLAASKRELVTAERKAAAEAEKEAKALKKAVDTINKTPPSVHRTTSALDKLQAMFSKLKRVTGDGDKALDRYSGRLGIILRIILILTPAISALAAVAVAGTAGILGMLGALALGGGAAMIAVTGVGEAIKAVESARLEPTAQNLEKARLALEGTSHSVREFVFGLSEAAQWAEKIRQRAQAGLFSGVNEGMGSLREMGPLLRRVAGTGGTAIGDVIADAAAALESPRWRGFLRYWEAELPDAVAKTAEASGNLFGGLVGWLKAMDPMTDGFLNWLVDVTEQFDQWGNNLEGSAGLERFFDYVDQMGPKLSNLLGATVDALVAIGMAAAPLSGPVLDSLTAVLRLITDLADSPLGPVLFAGITAMTLLTAATKAWGKAGELAAAQFVKGQLTAQNAAGKTRLTLAGLTKAAAFIGGTAAMSFGAGNAVSMGLMGAIAGPWGAVAGVTIGAMLDYASAQDTVTAAVEKFNDTVDRDPTALRAQQQAYDDLAASAQDYFDNMSLGTKVIEGWKLIAHDVFGVGENPLTQWNDELGEAADKLLQNRENMGKLFAVFDESGNGVDTTRGPAYVLKQLEEMAVNVTPALEKAGYSWESFLNLSSDDAWEAGRKILETFKQMDSEAGRTQGLVDAINDIGSAAITTAGSAQQLAGALDAVFSPTLDLEAATDAWRTSLQTLRTELNKGAGFKGFDKESMENRELTRQYVEDAKARLEALAAVPGTTRREVAAAVKETRELFISNAKAAGIDADVIERRANALKLTPELVDTLMRVTDDRNSRELVRDISSSLRGLPEKVLLHIQSEGIPKTRADVNALEKELDVKFTRKQRKVLLGLDDQVSNRVQGLDRAINRLTGRRKMVKIGVSDVGKPIEKIIGKDSAGGGKADRTLQVDADISVAKHKIDIVSSRIRDLNREKAKPKVDVEAEMAMQKLRSIQTIMRDIRNGAFGQIVLNTVRTGDDGVQKRDGGYITGPGGPRDDAIPAWLSNGEYVINAAATAKHIDLLHRINRGLPVETAPAKAAAPVVVVETPPPAPKPGQGGGSGGPDDGYFPGPPVHFSITAASDVDVVEAARKAYAGIVRDERERRIRNTLDWSD